MSDDRKERGLLALPAPPLLVELEQQIVNGELRPPQHRRRGREGLIFRIRQ